MYNYVHFDTVHKKFFNRENSFNRFKSITKEDLDRIKKDVEKFLSNISDSRKNASQELKGSEIYVRALQYITAPTITNGMRSFDEKIIFIIYCIDPELLMYKIYLSTNLNKSSTAVSSVNTPSVEQSPNLKDYNEQISKLIGITDPYILKYEERFFNKFHKDETLVKGVKNNRVKKLLAYAPIVTSLDKVSEERYKELVSLAHNWEEQNNYDDYNTRLSTIVYNILSQPKVLGLKTMVEQFILFILIIDPNLEMLRIYEEESMIPVIKKQIQERFGFFNQHLINIERQYHQRFCPELEVSSWLM